MRYELVGGIHLPYRIHDTKERREVFLSEAVDLLNKYQEMLTKK